MTVYHADGSQLPSCWQILWPNQWMPVSFEVFCSWASSVSTMNTRLCRIMFTAKLLQDGSEGWMKMFPTFKHSQSRGGTSQHLNIASVNLATTWHVHHHPFVRSSWRHFGRFYAMLGRTFGSRPIIRCGKRTVWRPFHGAAIGLVATGFGVGSPDLLVSSGFWNRVPTGVISFPGGITYMNVDLQIMYVYVELLV